MTVHVQAMLAWQRKGAVVFDYGNNLRQRAYDNGVEQAFDYPGFVPAYIRPLFCEGKGPFRWVALSGDPEDIYRTDQAILELFPDDDHLFRWITMARRTRGIPGATGPNLLAGIRRKSPGWTESSTNWSLRARSPRRSSSAATTWTAAPSPARTARPRP